MEKEGTFLVTHADGESAVLRDVVDSQVHTLADNPGVETGEVVEGRIAPEPPMEVAWRLVSVEDRRTVPVERSPEPPTRQERDLSPDEPGEIATTDRAGEGEIHVLRVPAEGTDEAVDDVVADEATLARAARLDVSRVEIRAEDGVVSVRYLP
ncbi:MAG: DUF5812 family protein [Haloarculaceae archaeon]